MLDKEKLISTLCQIQENIKLIKSKINSDLDIFMKGINNTLCMISIGDFDINEKKETCKYTLKKTYDSNEGCGHGGGMPCETELYIPECDPETPAYYEIYGDYCYNCGKPIEETKDENS